MKRFLPWLIPIIALLVAIPVLLVQEATTLAKIAGVVVVVLTTVAIRVWLYNANKQRRSDARVRLTVNDRYFLYEAFPYYKRMAGVEKILLEERAGLLLAEISFDHYDHKEVSKEDCLAFSMVLSLVTQDEAYSSCLDKIVVFWQEDRTGLGDQDNQKVLFINTRLLYAALKSFNGGSTQPVITGEAAQNLHFFYCS